MDAQLIISAIWAFIHTSSPYHFRTWLAIGILVDWLLLSTFVAGLFSLSKRQIVVHGTFFVPACILLHIGGLYFWNSPSAQRRFGSRFRMVASCMQINLWAACCLLVYANTENKLWVSTWWFVLLPAIVSAVPKVTGLLAAGMAVGALEMPYTGEAF